MDRAVDWLRERIKEWLPVGARNSLRALEYRARFAGRALVPGTRLRPALIIIGAKRGGTSSLFMTLVRHPGVARPIRKEIRYFDLNWHRPPSWYWRHFPRTAAAAGRLTCEASPGYLAHPDAPARARNLVPDAKIIAILRHPVERAISHYFHERLTGVERRSITSALDAPESDPPIVPTASDRTAFFRYLRQAYVARSRYARQLRPWLQAFGRDRVLVLFSEEYFCAPDSTLTRVVEFAGLPAVRIDAGRIYNKGMRTPLDRGLAGSLWERFRESNEELEELLGRRVPWTAP